MESNSSFENLILLWKPMRGITNLQIAEKAFASCAYISLSNNVPLTNYFQKILTKKEISKFIRSLLEKGCLNSESKLLPLLNSALENNTNVYIKIPIFTFERETLLDNGIEGKISLGSIIEFSKLVPPLTNERSIFKIENFEIYINREKVTSLCKLCKLNKRKISEDFCLYKTNTIYECLFNVTPNSPVFVLPNEQNNTLVFNNNVTDEELLNNVFSGTLQNILNEEDIH